MKATQNESKRKQMARMVAIEIEVFDLKTIHHRGRGGFTNQCVFNITS